VSALDPTTQQCLGALAPVFTFVMESILGLELKQPAVIFFITLTSIGAIVTGYATTENKNLVASDMSPIGEGGGYPVLDQWWAVGCAVVAAVASAAKLVLLRSSAIRAQLPPIAMLFWVDTFTFLLLTPVAIIVGEMSTLVDALAISGPAINALVAFTGALGGVRFASELYALQHIDAVDLSTVNTATSLTYVLISAPLFDLELPAERKTWAIGISLTFAGLFGYFLSVRHYVMEGTLVLLRCHLEPVRKTGLILWLTNCCNEGMASDEVCFVEDDVEPASEGAPAKLGPPDGEKRSTVCCACAPILAIFSPSSDHGKSKTGKDN